MASVAHVGRVLETDDANVSPGQRGQIASAEKVNKKERNTSQSESNHSATAGRREINDRGS